MKRDQETQTVEVHMSRYDGTDQEITIAITYPRTEEAPKRCVYITMTPANFALALTGRGGVKGEACEYVFGKVKLRDPAGDH